jgi:hypothetical protein
VAGVAADRLLERARLALGGDEVLHLVPAEARLLRQLLGVGSLACVWR